MTEAPSEESGLDRFLPWLLSADMRARRWIAGLALLLTASGCSASKRPVLYPNDHYKQVGQSQAEADIESCREQASHYASSNVQGREMATEGAKGGAIGAAGGAVGGAIGGNPGEGAAIGAAAGATAGVLGSLFRGAEPSGAYMGWVDQCLRDKGYQTVGWQ